ncbi:MAG TPA: hypothetical protein VHV83_19895, partial [Armatimonadota bacterium]|nr:hypothetical protein [Armatimonadota bacterium]
MTFKQFLSEFFSWTAGNVEADTYFCPERHGTYFSGFYMKDMPAMGKRNYNISTSITGDSGEAFVYQVCNDEQRKIMPAIPDQHRAAFQEVATVRRAISTELSKFLAGQTPDKAKVISLGRRYGELDGEMSWYYTIAFARVNKPLTDDQKAVLVKLRNLDGYQSLQLICTANRCRLHQHCRIPTSFSLYQRTKGDAHGRATYNDHRKCDSARGVLSDVCAVRRSDRQTCSTTEYLPYQQGTGLRWTSSSRGPQAAHLCRPRLWHSAWETDTTNTGTDLPKGHPIEVVLTGLKADTQYYYQLRSDEKAMVEGDFHTARPAGSTFSFTITADPH